MTTFPSIDVLWIVPVAERVYLSGRRRNAFPSSSFATVATEFARRKAYTSARLGVSTGDFTKRVSNPNAFNPAKFGRRLSTGGGGLPIKVGNDTIGGTAVAGAPGGDTDEASGPNSTKSRTS